MLSKLEQRIRACYDAFLEAVTEQHRDLWAIALLEYYRCPLEAWRAEPEKQWEQSVPACFADLAPELPRLVERKEEICPSDDFSTVQERLEAVYVRTFPHMFGSPARKLSPRAAALLLEYCLLVGAREDDPGDCRRRTLFDEEWDKEALERILKHGAETPEEQKALAQQLRALDDPQLLGEARTAWLLELTEGLLLGAIHGGCGEANWDLYQYLEDTEQLARWPGGPHALLQSAAKAGCADAQYAIGWLFCANMGRPDAYAQYSGEDISAEEAVYWMEQALPHKIGAALDLAQLFLEGKGVPADEARAVRYLTAAVEGRYGEGDAFFERGVCCEMLAECYAEGQGVAKDRRKAAELYCQALDSGCFLFDYYTDGVDVPRDPRAAVRYWMRDMCDLYRLELWNLVLSLVSSAGSCAARPSPEQIRLLLEGERSEEPDFDHRPRVPMGRVNDRYLLLCSLLEQEKVRLLYDGAQGGNAWCGIILRSLLASGAATGEMLAQLSPNGSGICDWPDAWYEEALERIEDQMAREARMLQQSGGGSGPAPEAPAPAENTGDWYLYDGPEIE